MRMRLFLKSLMTVIIALSIAITGIIYSPATAGADEPTDAASTDNSLDDSEDQDDDEGDDEDDDDEEDDDYEMDFVVNFCATSISKKSVKLKWDKVNDIDGYELSYKKASSSKWTTKQISKSKTSFKVTKLKVNTKYNFRIRTFINYLDDDDNDDEEEEDYENEEDYEDEEDDDEEDEEDLDDYEYSKYSRMNLRTLKKNGSGKKQAFSDTYEKSAPKNISVPLIKKVALKSAKATVTWKKSAKAKGYEVYMSKKPKSRFKRVAKINKVKTVKYTTKKLKKGTKYYFKVRAFVKKGSHTLYTKYSKVKSIKTK